jgi:Uma2 family endonuclease
MATKTLLTILDYGALNEPEGARYELSEGELIVSPSANYFHNRIRDRFNVRLLPFVERRNLGSVISEMDFQLGEDTVRRPDVAFISAARLEGVDLERVPLPVAPDLAIEIVSPNDRAADLLVKVFQYLAAGSKAVWLFYPNTRLAYRYLPGKLEPEVRSAQEDHSFEEPGLLPGFQLTLAQIFE